jgi:AcrR family transcriptional regulator
MSPSSAPARDSTLTRQRILDAGAEEFAARGLAGARVASIVEQAGVNPRMVYVHFGSKEGLFRAVIEEAVLRMQDAVTLDPSDLVGYALAIFDAHAAAPDLIRLALWQELESPGLAEHIASIESANSTKTAAITVAQQGGIVPDVLPAAELLDAIQALVYGNLILTDRLGDFSAARRDAVRRAVTALLRP